MMFGLFTKKQMEEELSRRLHEEYLRRQMQDDLEDLRKHLSLIDRDLFELKLKIDPPEKPMCGSDAVREG